MSSQSPGQNYRVIQTLLAYAKDEKMLGILTEYPQSVTSSHTLKKIKFKENKNRFYEA